MQEIKTGISESPGVQVINEALPKLKADLDSRTTETARILSARPSLETLRTTEQDWQALTKNITAWKKDLKAQIGVFDGQIEELKNQNEVWQKTLDALGKSQNTNSTSQNTSGNNAEILSNTNAATNSNAENSTENITEIPPEVLQKIQTVIASIKETQKQIEEKRGELLTLQTRISEQETRINETLASIKEVRDKALTNLFVQDSPAIWNVQRRTDSTETLYQETENTLTTQAAALSEYFRRQAGGFVLHGIIFLGFVGALFWARRRTRPFVEIEPELERAVMIFKLPFATALILTILLSGWFYPQAPRLLSSLLGAAALIPVVILLRRLLEKPLFPILNALVIFYFVDRLREVSAALPLVSRVLFLAEMAGAIIFLVWFLRSKRLSSKIEAQHFRIFTVIKKTIPFALAIFAAAFFANIFGFVSLSNVIGNGILGSAYIALILIYRRADRRKSSAYSHFVCDRWFHCKWSENIASLSAQKSSAF